MSRPAMSGLTSISATRSARSAARTENSAIDSARRSRSTAARAAIAVEQAPELEPVEQPARGRSPERRERGAPIVEQLDQHAAGADHDDRAELRIADHAERQFDAALGHRRDQRARPEPRRQIAIGVEQGRLVGEAEPHAADVGLVQDAGSAVLQATG